MDGEGESKGSMLSACIDDDDNDDCMHVRVQSCANAQGVQFLVSIVDISNLFAHINMDRSVCK